MHYETRSFQQAVTQFSFITGKKLYPGVILITVLESRVEFLLPLKKSLNLIEQGHGDHGLTLQYKGGLNSRVM